MTSYRFSRWRPSATLNLLYGNDRPPTKCTGTWRSHLIPKCRLDRIYSFGYIVIFYFFISCVTCWTQCRRPTRSTCIPVNLTPSTPAVHNCCCSNGSAPYWSNPPFLFFLTLGHSGVQSRVPECQKLKMVGQTSMVKYKALTGSAVKALKESVPSVVRAIDWRLAHYSIERRISTFLCFA